MPSVPSSKPGRTSNKLPVPRTALSALDKARKAQTLAEKQLCINAIVSAALADGPQLDSIPLTYILKRLINGVSVSAHNTRLNFSNALIIITRTLTSENPRASDHILLLVKAVYGPEGSFDPNYSGAERERALGILSACAAVVSASSGNLSSASSRQLVSLLRSCVDGDARKWRLGCAAVRVIIHLLNISESKVGDAVRKPLWQWCEQRCKFDDGLHLSLSLLLNFKLISQSAFERLYPTLTGAFATALLDTFESGFSCLAKSMLTKDTNNSSNSIVSEGWVLALQYASSDAGKKHIGGLEQFWNLIVLDRLSKGAKISEKKLLVLELMPLIIKYIPNPVIFNSIFKRSSSSLVGICGAVRHTKKSGALGKGGFPAKELLVRIQKAVYSLGVTVVAKIVHFHRSKTEAAPILRAFLLWCMRGGVLNRVFPSDSLANVIDNLEREEISKIFNQTILEFARPANDGYDEKEFISLCNSSIRSHSLRFAFYIATRHAFLRHDIVKIVSLYSIFEEGGNEITSYPKSIVSFNTFVNVLDGEPASELLPSLKPTLSEDAARISFRRLIHFLADTGYEDGERRLSSVCVDLLRNVTCSESLLQPRKYTASKGHDHGNDVEKLMNEIIIPITKKLSEKPGDANNIAIFDSLRVISEYLTLILYGPLIESRELESNNYAQVEDFSALCHNLSTCVEHVISNQDGEKLNVGNNIAVVDNGLNTQPEPIEEVVHLIADLCGREAVSSRKIAMRAIEALEKCLDDKVVAVLFDSMDSYLSGVGVTQAHLDSEDIDSNADIEIGANSGSEEDSISEMEEPESEKHKADEGGSEIAANQSGSDSNDCEVQHADNSAHGIAEGNTIGSSDDESSRNSIEMDVDDEDPAVLAEFDKRLASHLKLMSVEKKAAAQRSLKMQFRYVQVSRMLVIIETVARVLRIRLETSDDVDVRTPLVFLDLHVHLYEFALREDADNLRYLGQVASIISKQMIISPSLLVRNISDVQTVLDIVDRFMNALINCQANRKLLPEEIRAISKSAGFLVGIAANLTESGYRRFFPAYEDLLQAMLRPCPSHISCPGIFASILQKAPTVSLKLLPIVENSLSEKNVPMSVKASFSEMVLALAYSMYQLNDTSECDASFWASFRELIEKYPGKEVKKTRNSYCLGNIVQAVSYGIKRGSILDVESLTVHVSNVIHASKLQHREQLKLLKMIKLPLSNGKDKRIQNAATCLKIPGKKHRSQATHVAS